MKHTEVRKTENGKIEIKIRLSDDCKNGICEFAITADIYELNKRGRYIWVSGGCCHDDILKYAPEFADFVRLHLSNVHGEPMYAAENGLYWTKQSPAKGAEYLRISEDLAKSLPLDLPGFKAALFELGIVDQWKAEAAAAIAHLESLTGEKWVNPYKEDEERFRLRITAEELADYRAKVAAGYYKPEAIAKREADRIKAEKAKERAGIVERYKKERAESEEKERVELYIFDTLGTLENIIYYTHTKTVSFNWRSYGDKRWTREEFDNFVNSADLSKLPEGVKFEIK